MFLCSFSDASPDSPRLGLHNVSVSPHSQGATFHRASPEQNPPTPATASPSTPSPSRPSSLPGVAASPVTAAVSSSTTSQPIPVPSQVKAYEQIQRSIGGSPNSPGHASQGSQKSPSPAQIPLQPSPQGMPIPRKNSTGSVPSVGSMSPPSVHFTIGTPPSSTWRRSSVASGATPPACSSPLRKQHSASPLPTIVGSPTKVPPGFVFPSPDGTTAMQDSPSSPLQTPFGNRPRTKTCPDNIAAVGYDVECEWDFLFKSLMITSVPWINAHFISPFQARAWSLWACLWTEAAQTQAPCSRGALVEANSLSNSSKLPSAHWLHPIIQVSPIIDPSHVQPALILHLFPVPGCVSPSNNSMVPYSSSQGSLHHVASAPGLRDRTTSLSRQRRLSGAEEAPSNLPFTQSPPNMEGPIMFVAPELAEETLMDVSTFASCLLSCTLSASFSCALLWSL